VIYCYPKEHMKTMTNETTAEPVPTLLDVLRDVEREIDRLNPSARCVAALAALCGVVTAWAYATGII
jgi:hypothetical protein